MANRNGSVPELKEPIAATNSPFQDDFQDVNYMTARLKELLGELDTMGFPRAATYLSMAIDQIEADFTPKSK